MVPNDVIYLYSEPQTFVALGAVGGGTTGGQGQYKFDAWRISLAEAVAKQGGLLDAQADPAAVFLYRGEPKEVARELGVEVDQFPGANRSCDLPGQFPRSARLLPCTKLRNAEQGCYLHVQCASWVEITKVLTFLRTVMATANDPIIYAANYLLPGRPLPGVQGQLPR